MIDVRRVKEVGARCCRAGDIGFFGDVLFEFGVRSARSELELLCEQVEGALEANLQSRIRDSGAGIESKEISAFFIVSGQ